FTLPTSTGCLVAAEATSRTNVFLPLVHCPDSLSSMMVISFAFCVWITFRSAPQTAPRDSPTSSTTPSTAFMMTRCISHFSSLLLGHHVHRPTRTPAARGGSGLFRQLPPSPRDGVHGRVASKS